MIFMSREQVREYDKIAMARYGVMGPVLMENAGRGATEVALDMLSIRDGRTTIVCGKGNNGGDGFVIARHLHNAGHRVRVILLGELAQLRGDAKINGNIIEAMKLDLIEVPTEDDIEKLIPLLSHSAVVVDAIFGTGLERPVVGRYNRAIEIINEARAPVLAVDLPSGLDSNTGQPLGTCVKAERTATFVCLKRGLVVHPGAEFAGDVTVVDIGTPRAIIDEVGFDGRLVTTARIAGALPPRKPDTHKGTYGHLLIIAGSAGKSGAALLAASASLRTGTGLVTLAVPTDLLATIEAHKPTEVMLEPLLESIDSSVELAHLSRLSTLLGGKTAVAFGPGCGLTESMSTLLEETLKRATVPVVIDADGLTLLAKFPREVLGDREHPTVLTPHPGEMARLTEMTTTSLQANRITTARTYTGGTGTHLVLKGAHTIISSPRGEILVNTTGNPGMATAGTGDVLTGMLGSLLAQKLDPLEACAAATHIHGLAGDRAASEFTEQSLVASDLLDQLPAVLKDLQA